MSSLEQLCLDRGLSMSRQRRSIIRVLSEAKEHLSAADLHRRVAALDPEISLATVYRTLTIFEAAGVLKRFDFGDQTMRYEDAAKAPHDHLIDVMDGSVVEFRAPEVAALLAEIVAGLGYRLEGYRLDVFASPADSRNTAASPGLRRPSVRLRSLRPRRRLLADRC
jgi:Fur family ferric uptake transcriptional regulator